MAPAPPPNPTRPLSPPPSEASKPSAPRSRWRVIQRRHRREAPTTPLPAYDPATPWYIEHASPEPRYAGSNTVASREVRRELERQRFERFRARPFASWVEDPGFFWQLALLILLTLALVLFLVLAWNNPPQRVH